MVLSPNDQKDLSFDAFFTHIVVHELMHGLGPHDVNTGSQKTTVRQALKDAYSALEEAKADISGLFAIQYMIGKGVLPKSLERPLYTPRCAASHAVDTTASGWRCNSITCSITAPLS